MTHGTIECAERGLQDETFVCQHIVESLRDGKPRGFFCSTESDVPRPDAWCAECQARLAKTGGEWTEEAEEKAGVSLLCGGCYDRVKTLNIFA